MKILNNDVVDLLMSIEDEFGVEVPDDEIENIKTVGSLVSYIEANGNNRQDLNPFTALSNLSKGNSPDCLQSCCPFLKRIKVGIM